jgi:hypothetical protein
MEGAAVEAEIFLAGHTEEHQRLDRVSRLIEGFETPYGMELLSSVHWLAVHGTPAAETVRDAVSGITAWNERKRRMFRAEHIGVAWNRLVEENWITGTHEHTTEETH